MHTSQRMCRDCKCRTLTKANDTVEYDWVPFDPYQHLQPVSFKLGPIDYKIIDWKQPSTRFLCVTQLFGILTDLRNLMSGTNQPIELSKSPEIEDFGPEELDENNMVTNILPHNLGAREDDGPLSPIKTGRTDLFADGHDQEQIHNLSQEIQEPIEAEGSKHVSFNIKDEVLDFIDLETLIQLLRYRIKNNSLGQIHYLPEEWNGKFPSDYRLQIQETQSHLHQAVPEREGRVRPSHNAAYLDEIPNANSTRIAEIPRSSDSQGNLPRRVCSVFRLARRIR